LSFRETTAKKRGTWMNDQERRASTEALFRDVNERIAESAQRFDAPSTEFVCECADPSCTDRVEATLDEYEEVRADGATFLLAPGHEDPRIERVVAATGRFHVVEKMQRKVREMVMRLDPRARPSAASERG
jgi:transcription initiation factor TFIID subunit TAF12